jgi:uridine kinase
VVVEGHLIFANKELRDTFDLKIYIDADDDVRLSRRILKAMKDGEKDGKKFGLHRLLTSFYSLAF